MSKPSCLNCKYWQSHKQFWRDTAYCTIGIPKRIVAARDSTGRAIKYRETITYLARHSGDLCNDYDELTPAESQRRIWDAALRAVDRENAAP